MTTLPGYEPNSAKSRAPRDRNIPLPKGAVRLQARDMELLDDLYAYGCMLRGQIQELYFGSVQRANARLRVLFDARYVVKATLPLPSCLGASTGCQTAYMIGPSAIPIVAARLGLEPAEVRRQQRHGTPSYVLHTTEIVQVWLAVRAGVQSDPTVHLDRFLPERLCQHRYEYRQRLEGRESVDAPWRTEIYKPDAVMVLTWPTGSVGFGIEVDLGHVAAQEIVLKSKICTRYAQSGLFLKRYGVELAHTLFITTSAKRRDNLKALLEHEKNHDFWFSTFAEVASDGMLGPIWHAPFTNGIQALKP